MDQVLDRDYPQVLRNLGVPILLVAVTYDSETREHTCGTMVTGAFVRAQARQTSPSPYSGRPRQ